MMKPGHTRPSVKESVAEATDAQARASGDKGGTVCRIYVKRNEYQRFDTLYHAFRTSIPGADVLWDRRMRDRRHRREPAVAVDRRWVERRTLPPESWHALGFVVTQARDTSRRRAPLPLPLPRRAPAPRLLPHGLVEPSLADARGAFVRIAESLVGEIVRRLKTPPQAGQRAAPVPPAAPAAAAEPAPPAPTVPAAPPEAETTWKLVWPVHAERN